MKMQGSPSGKGWARAWRAGRAALVALGLIGGGAAPALAADGAMGPTSTASVTISVSVAPRAWQSGADRLCVAAPASGYSLRLAGSDQPLAQTSTGTSGACALNGQAAALPVGLPASGQTLLVVAE